MCADVQREGGFTSVCVLFRSPEFGKTSAMPYIFGEFAFLYLLLVSSILFFILSGELMRFYYNGCSGGLVGALISQNEGKKVKVRGGHDKLMCSGDSSGV